MGEGNDVLVVPPERTNKEIREAFLILARALTIHVIGVSEYCGEHYDN